jgi:hypothetical protein
MTLDPGAFMRRFTIALALVAGVTTSTAAQQSDTSPARAGPPRDVAREATRRYNQPLALRSTDRTVIEEDQIIDGDVAVLDGPLIVAGRVRGRVLAINSDVMLRSTARVDGDLLVVGGEVEGRHTAYIGGEIRIYRERLRYVHDGDRLEPETVGTTDETAWWRRWNDRPRRSGSKLQIASAGAYNRVEGLPINLGPQVFQRLARGSVKIDAYAVIRTETSFDGERGGDIGHNVSAEVRLGRRGGPLLGAQLFDVVEPTQAWQLSELEAGLAAFLVRRDYLDYFGRHGGQARIGFFLRRGVDLTTAYSHERWSARPATNVWTLFRTDVPWRPNPLFDEGVLHLVNNTLRVDTRNDSWSPWAGWYILADLEHEFGKFTTYTSCSPPACDSPYPLYSARGFLDLRRYNRLSPNAQLNFRVVTGGRLNGDPLPTQRRFAVDGPGVLPGFGFRSTPSPNNATCDSAAPGTPGMCERMLLVQAEYRGDLHLDLFGDWGDDRYTRTGADGVWVFFLDAGRGWALESAPNQIGYGMYAIPPLSTFRSDLGVGLDFELFGLYAAKALSDGSEPVNFFMRIRHRF